MILSILTIHTVVDSGDASRNLAILQLKPIGLQTAVAETLTEALQSEFVRLRQYLVLDRSNIKQLLEEQQMQQTDCTDAACAVKVGKILNSQWVVVGSISQLENTYLFVTNIVDVESSRIVNSAQIQQTKLTAVVKAIPAMVQELVASTVFNQNSKVSKKPETTDSSGGKASISAKAPELATGGQTTPQGGLPPVKGAAGKTNAHPELPVVAGHGSPPTIELLETPKARLSLKDAKSVRFRYSGKDVQCIDGYRYRLDDQEMVSDKRASVEFSNVTIGSHTFQVQAVNCEGNYSAGVSFAFEVANLPPQVSIVSPKANEKVFGKQLRVELQGVDEDGTVVAFRCALNNPSAAKEQKSPVFLFDAADGKSLIFAQVTDDDGAESEWERREVEFEYTSEAMEAFWRATTEASKRLKNVNALPAGFVLIPAGSFMLGSPKYEKCREEDEIQNQVSITKPFFLATTETSGAQFATFIRKANYKCKAFTTLGDHPVTKVTWYDAVVYCNWLSESEGLQRCYSGSGDSVQCDFTGNGYRLPTEAEWEYACRAGTTDLFNTGSDLGGCEADSRSTALDEAGWYTGNSGGKTHPVHGKSPNAWGLYDMHGNVWEWCWDWYDHYSYAMASDPRGSSTGVHRVLRGGGWNNSAGLCRSAYRSWNEPSFSDSNIGFRVVRLAPQD